MRISNDDYALFLRRKNKLLQLLIVRNIMKTYNMINALLSIITFKTILKLMLRLLEYFDIIIVYAIRRTLKNKINNNNFRILRFRESALLIVYYIKKYIKIQRFQHINQNNSRIYD